MGMDLHINRGYIWVILPDVEHYLETMGAVLGTMDESDRSGN
jgi:hypothetical protein